MWYVIGNCSISHNDDATNTRSRFGRIALTPSMITENMIEINISNSYKICTLLLTWYNIDIIDITMTYFNVHDSLNSPRAANQWFWINSCINNNNNNF